MEACIRAIISAVNRSFDPPDYRKSLPRLLVALLLAVGAGVALADTDAAADANPADAQAGTEVPVPDPLVLAEQALQRQDALGAAREFTAAALASDDPEVAERATQFTFTIGADALAEQSAQRWQELAPDIGAPYEVLGRLKLRRHAVDEAVLDLDRALGPGEPRREETYLALAADLSVEEPRRVTQALARLTAQDPLAPGLQLALGTAALRSGDYDLALYAGERAGLDDPQWTEPQILVARALAATGQGDEALARLGAMAASSPNPLVDLEYARLLADLGRFDAAREKLDALTAEYGSRPEIDRTRAFLELAAGDLDAADRAFETNEGTGQERFESFYYRAQIAARRGDVENARRLYGRISSGPYLVPAQLAIAESLWREGRTERAIDRLEAFGRDHPAQAFDVLEFRAQLLQTLARSDESLAVYGEALAYKPASVSVLLARGALYEQLGQMDAALADLAAAARIAPDDPMALNAYGYTLANRTRQAAEGWIPIRLAMELSPRSPPIQDSAGWALYKLRRRDEARSFLEEAYAALPDPEIGSHLAEVYWSEGERQRAQELLDAAAAAHPDNVTVQKTRERLRR
jgi:tetratricopeptide (TPR) repeat protein